MAAVELWRCFRLPLMNGSRPVTHVGSKRVRHSHEQPHTKRRTKVVTTPTRVSTGWSGGICGGGTTGGAGGAGGGGLGALKPRTTAIGSVMSRIVTPSAAERAVGVKPLS